MKLNPERFRPGKDIFYYYYYCYYFCTRLEYATVRHAGYELGWLPTRVGLSHGRRGDLGPEDSRNASEGHLPSSFVQPVGHCGNRPLG